MRAEELSFPYNMYVMRNLKAETKELCRVEVELAHLKEKRENYISVKGFGKPQNGILK